MIYIAAPYGHEDRAVIEVRMELFYRLDAQLSRAGEHTISPLHKVEMCKRSEMPDNWVFWENYSYDLLSRCDKLVVMMMDGWVESPGVQAEIKYSVEHGIPVEYIDMETCFK